MDRIQTLYTELAADERRNHLILDDVATALGEGRSPILLTERKDHLESLAARPACAISRPPAGSARASTIRSSTPTLGPLTRCSRRLARSPGRADGTAATGAQLQRRWLASRAPSESIRNFSHMMLGCTRAGARPCANPQSTPAMTFSRPTILA